MQLQICRLLLTFAKSLEPDQAKHNSQSKLEQKCLTLRWNYRLSFFFFLKKKYPKTTTIITKHAELTYLLERALFD